MVDLEFLADFHSYLKEQKEQHNKKIIAFMAHDNIPEELLDAAGFIPLRMIFAGDDDLMNKSHDYLPPSTCSFAQSCIGLFALKPSPYSFLDLVDYFLVSNHCVSDICASEIICKYYFIPRLNFYASYTQSDNAIKYFKLELLELKKELELISEIEIKDEDIIESIKKYNRFKKLLSDFNALNVKGTIKLSTFQKAILYGPTFIPELEKIIETHKDTSNNLSDNTKNLVFTGCSIFIGDYLNDLIEDGGGNILFFDTWVGHNYFSQIISEAILNSNMEPLDILTERYKNNIYSDHPVPNSFDNKITLIKDYIQKYKQDSGKKIGVINHIIKFCDHINMYQSYLKKLLREDGIQVLNLERDYSRANRGQLTTRIEAFLEML
jgi:benzoyl-CoA reductase/2-hydroxyglutaryl-CoA dehydratase subunit BcrC/BadD/HgdB